MARTFTREEFYDLVWSKPMTQLAKDFALSDVALHKICKKHGIPNPPPGWWAKQAAGKPVKRTALPRLKAESVRTITIAAGHLKQEPEAMAVAREKARMLASSVEVEGATVQHVVVSETLRALRRAGPPSPQGLILASGAGRAKVEVSPASIERVELILGRLAAAAQALGVELAADDKGAFLRHSDEVIRFSMSESYRRQKHVLTEAEQVRLAAWEKKHEKVLRKGGWEAIMLPGRPQFVEWDYEPTGQLSFEMDAPYLYGSSPRRTFRDAKIQRLEKMAIDILVGVHVLAAALQEDRRKRDLAERQRRETQERRERALRDRHILERRNAALDDLLRQIADLDRLRRLVASLHKQLGDQPSGRVAEFITFAETRLRENEQALEAEGLLSRFETARLFGDDDDYDFQSPAFGY